MWLVVVKVALRPIYNTHHVRQPVAPSCLTTRQLPRPASRQRVFYPLPVTRFLKHTECRSLDWHIGLRLFPFRSSKRGRAFRDKVELLPSFFRRAV